MGVALEKKHIIIIELVYKDGRKKESRVRKIGSELGKKREDGTEFKIKWGIEFPSWRSG